VRTYAHEHRPRLSVSRPVLVAATYLGVVAALIYAFMDRHVGSASAGIVLVGFLVVLNFAAGYLARSWAAVLLPVAAVLIAVPAGYPPVGPGNGDPLPVWFGFAFTAPVAMALIAAGAFAARYLGRRR